MSTKHHCDSCDKEIDWVHEIEWSTHSPTIVGSLNESEKMELCNECMQSFQYFLRRIKKYYSTSH